MIGTGVFTSVGFQLSAVQSTWSILLLWILGGVLALFGAFAYAELGTHFPHSGGDYIYLSRIFHPIAGFLSAWAGLTAGFSAPVALAAIAFTKYLSPFNLYGGKWLAILLIVAVGLMHSFTIRHSSRFQNITTAVKILFIVVLIITGFVLPAQSTNAISFSDNWTKEIVSPGFAVSMVFVFFAYTGWNSAAYVTGEIDKPFINLPKALIISTIFVAVVYVLFQMVLLRHATVLQLAGKEEVTFISFNNLLGSNGGKWVSIFIAIQLVATVSSYLWVGPRVTWAMAKENYFWRFLSIKNKHGIPVAAIWLHVAISIVLTLTGSFENILLYCGFVLQLMGSLTVASSLWINNKSKDVFRSPWKPVIQIIFLLFNAWVLIFTLIDRTKESIMGLSILLAGVIVFFAGRRISGIKSKSSIEE